MNYSNLNLNINVSVNTINVFDDTVINVLKYASIEDKNDIISLALQASTEENGINLLKAKMFFELYIVYIYTDIDFINNEKDEPIKLYDELKSSGLLDTILMALDPKEYEELISMFNRTMRMRIAHSNTIASIFNRFVSELPTNANEAKSIIEQFDPSAFQRVLDFAKAANGDRAID